MRVQMLHECRVPISASAKKVYPAGWEGFVDDALGADMVATGYAIDPDNPPVASELEQHPGDAVGRVGGDLKTLKLDELRTRAADAGIADAAHMKKAALIAALEATAVAAATQATG